MPLSEELMEELQSEINSRIDPGKEVTDNELLEIITDTVLSSSKNNYLSLKEKQAVINNIFNNMIRLGIIQPLVDDDTITEIMINGPDNIFIERNGKITKTDLAFDSVDKLEDVIQSVVSRVNRSVNEANPIVDARLQDGSRVNVVLKPVALNGPIMTIRKFGKQPLNMRELVANGTLTDEAANFLGKLVRAKYNIFICGGTGSGKTTFLNCLSSYIPGDERIVTIEDSAELKLPGLNNIVMLETRNANTQGKGEITIRDLIRTSLRMRPERIIVGEVRGPEALDMLQAMNTGHDGSLSTGHANSCLDMLSRLETMVLMAATLPLNAVRQQIASSIEILVHIGIMRDGSRKILEITELDGCKGGTYRLNPLFLINENGSLVRTGNPLKNTLKMKRYGWGDDESEL